jgi:hypothetical protein
MGWAKAALRDGKQLIEEERGGQSVSSERQGSCGARETRRVAPFPSFLILPTPRTLRFGQIGIPVYKSGTHLLIPAPKPATQ